MFKGFTVVSAALFSGVLSAGTTLMTTCPNLDEIDIASSISLRETLVPGKLYVIKKLVRQNADDNAWWIIFVGPIKATTGDSVFDIADYIISKTLVTGELEHTDEGDVCLYNSGDPSVYVSVEIAHD
jgi:hypothetical protein